MAVTRWRAPGGRSSSGSTAMSCCAGMTVPATGCTSRKTSWCPARSRRAPYSTAHSPPNKPRSLVPCWETGLCEDVYYLEQSGSLAGPKPEASPQPRDGRADGCHSGEELQLESQPTRFMLLRRVEPRA